MAGDARGAPACHSKGQKGGGKEVGVEGGCDMHYCVRILILEFKDRRMLHILSGVKVSYKVLG